MQLGELGLFLSKHPCWRIGKWPHSQRETKNTSLSKLQQNTWKQRIRVGMVTWEGRRGGYMSNWAGVKGSRCNRCNGVCQRWKPLALWNDWDVSGPCPKAGRSLKEGLAKSWTVQLSVSSCQVPPCPPHGLVGPKKYLRSSGFGYQNGSRFLQVYA